MMLCVLVFIVFVYFVLFFFKQKTAYEMRISDWSSDVCSSDLFHRTERNSDRRGGVVAGWGGSPRSRESVIGCYLGMGTADVERRLRARAKLTKLTVRRG